MINYFSNTGITATSANHIANMAKEYYESLQTELSNIRFFNTEVELLTAGKKVLTFNGLVNITHIESNIRQISECKALIAYLREAIKAKEQLTLEVDNAHPDEIVFPKAPTYPNKKTADDIMNVWPIDKVSRYYRLQTFAATYGELVHPKGSLSIARKNLLDKINNPTSVDLNGSETIISTFTPTVSFQEEEDMFFSIQKSYRAYQAEFNGMKTELEQSVREINDSLLNQYTVEYQTYKNENELAIEALFKWRENEKRKIEKLKIVIPDNLKSIYEIINNLSKK